jgi:hypothetical protein
MENIRFADEQINEIFSRLFNKLPDYLQKPLLGTGIA